MTTCCGCGTKFDFDTPGIVIKPVSAEVSGKSGRPVLQVDYFPDGSTEKFLCADCLHKTSEVARLLGFYETSDFPREEATYSEPNVHSMSAAYTTWAASNKS